MRYFMGYGYGNSRWVVNGIMIQWLKFIKGLPVIMYNKQNLQLVKGI